MLHQLFKALGDAAASLTRLASPLLAEERQGDPDVRQAYDDLALAEYLEFLVRQAYDDLALAEYLEFLVAQQAAVCSDLEELIAYVLEHEAEDFADHVDECVPAPGVPDEEWEDRFGSFVAERKDEDFDWLALNSEGHIYCTAVRLRRKLAALAVTDPRPLTDQELAYYRDGGESCPFCREAFEGHQVVIDGLYARQEAHCTSCSAAWTDEYRFVGYTVNEKPEHGEEDG